LRKEKSTVRSKLILRKIETMDKYESICDLLDLLALRNLRTSNDLIRLKLDLENRLRDGWMGLAKSRYVAGFHRFGIVNLTDYEEAIPDSTGGPQVVIDLDSPTATNKSKSNDDLKSNVAATKFILRVDGGELDEKAAKEEMERKAMRRFGSFAPPIFKQSQRTFGTVIELVCEIATLESELVGISKEYKRLSEMKAKYSGED